MQSSHSYEFGDIWTLIFNHLQLNFGSFIGAIGAGVTSSSGGMRVPTIHKVFLSSSELTEDQQFYVCGLLRLYRDEVIISTQQLTSLMSNPQLDLKFKRNIERVLAKPDTLYSIPIGSLSPSVSNENCFLASNFPHFHRYDSLKSALYIHAISKNINTFPKNQGRIRAAIAVEILDFTVMYR